MSVLSKDLLGTASTATSATTTTTTDYTAQRVVVAHSRPQTRVLVARLSDDRAGRLVLLVRAIRVVDRSQRNLKGCRQDHLALKDDSASKCSTHYTDVPH